MKDKEIEKCQLDTIADILGIRVEELCPEGKLNYHVPILYVLECMDKWHEQQTQQVKEGHQPYQYASGLYTGLYEVQDSYGNIFEAVFNDINNEWECEEYIVSYKRID